MLKKDIIARTIRLLRDAIAKVVARREAGDLVEAERLLGRACSDHLALELPFLVELPLPQLLAMFSTDAELDAARGIVAGELLEQAAAHSAQQGDAGAAQALSRKALALYLHSFAVLLDRQMRDYANKIINIYEADPDWPGQPPQLHNVLRAYELAGAFDRAEDLLFNLVDAGVAAAQEQGQAMYQRLLRLPDDVLAEGGLPRAEVEESLAELRGR